MRNEQSFRRVLSISGLIGSVALLLSPTLQSQSPPPPRLIYRFVIPDTNEDAARLLEMANLGDRGSTLDLAGGGYVNSSVKDGFDDFVVLLDRADSSGNASVWVYDGRTGRRYKAPSGAPLEYSLPASEFASQRQGMCADGGKDLVGSSTHPDLALGAPGFGSGTGRVYLLDGETLDPNITPPSGPWGKVLDAVDPADRAFGSSVGLMGDFAGNGRSELLVGAADSILPGSRCDIATGQTDCRGLAHAIDLDFNGAIRILATLQSPHDPFGPNPFDKGEEFGHQVAVIGNLATKVAGIDQWGRDGSPEFAVSDPLWSFNPSSVPPQLNWGLVGWFNSFNLDVQQAPTVVVQYYTANGIDFARHGQYLLPAGDLDLGANLPGAVTGSWDLLVGEQHRHLYFYTDPNSIAATLPLAVQGNLSLEQYPNWLTPFANQIAAVGDIDLDASVDGTDEVASVDFEVAQATNHVVRIRNGIGLPAAELYRIDRDPGTALQLLGTPGQLRTTVTKVGDVDGDGLDDFGVISGYDDDPTGGQDSPNHAVILIYGSPLFPPPGGQGGGGGGIGGQINPKPKLTGNKVAQRGSRIRLMIENCPVGAAVTLYESTSLTSPGIPECGAQRVVQGTSYSLTANSEGRVYFVRDLSYVSANPSDHTLGTVWHYQARREAAGGFTCRLSDVWSLTIIDSSNPLDEYPGDS